MPVTVIVGPVGEEATRLTFDGTQRIVFGRGASCDVRLPDTSVSHRHAYLCADGGVFLLFDEGSTNGTHVGGVAIGSRTSRVVRSGDIVRMGRVTVQLRMDGTPVTRDAGTSTRDMALFFVSRALEAAGKDIGIGVRVVEGRDQGSVMHLKEEGWEYLVGRGAECDLVLQDADASRQHVGVRRNGQNVCVKDLHSKNGTWMGSVRLDGEQDIEWQSPIMLRVGRTVLALERPVHDALALLEAAPDEPLHALDDVGSETSQPPIGDGPPGERAPDVTSLASETVAAAPIAVIPGAASPARAPAARPGRWSLFDILVVLASLTVLALSLLGLVWLLRS
jgi:pSer/pThr/pTyr-binding forkhead associated (FHA) protein